MDLLLNLQPGKWKDSKYDSDGDLSAFSQKFDEGVKRVFSDDQVPQHVRFGSPRDNDPKYGVKAGRITLTGLTLTHPLTNLHLNFCPYSSEVAGFFEPSIQSIMDCIKDKSSKRIAANSVRIIVASRAIFLITK